MRQTPPWRCVLEPFQDVLPRLRTIPGVSRIVAQTVVAVIGVDRARFPTAAHLVSWTSLCPRMDESAGKRRSTRLRRGAPWLKTVLVQAAWSATRKRNGHLAAQFHRLRARRGPKTAIAAVAASLLTAADYILCNGTVYQDLGGQYFDQRHKARTVRRLTRRLEGLGYRPGQDGLSGDVSIDVNGQLHGKLKTSCWEPTGAGLPVGDFEITEARSKDNGLMCPLNTCDVAGAGILELHDREMDGSEDWNTLQGNGKANEIGLVNGWILKGIVDARSTLICPAP